MNEKITEKSRHNIFAVIVVIFAVFCGSWNKNAVECGILRKILCLGKSLRCQNT
jgi:hypothetical protein